MPSPFLQLTRFAWFAPTFALWMNAIGKTGGALLRLSTESAGTPAGSVNISQSIFTNNSAENGGAVVLTGDNLAVQLDNSSFMGNTARGQAGAITTQKSKPHTPGWLQLAAQDTNFTSNTAGQGGALLALETDVELTGCNFDGNTATMLPGGGLYSDSMRSLVINTSSFSNNKGMPASAIHLMPATSVQKTN